MGVVAFLRRLVYGRGPNEYLFGSLRRPLLEEFARAQIELGFPVPIFVLHSLRHGGASFDFLTNVPIEKIMVHGRWAAIKITRRYIQESQARMLSMDIPAAVKRRIAVYLASERSCGSGRLFEHGVCWITLLGMVGWVSLGHGNVPP